MEVEAYLNLSLLLPTLERDLLSQAVNELIDELPHPPRATYSNSRDGTGNPYSTGRR